MLGFEVAQRVFTSLACAIVLACLFSLLSWFKELIELGFGNGNGTKASVS